MENHHLVRPSAFRRILPNGIRTVALLAALVAVSASAMAQPVKLDFPPDSPGVPAYARLELLIPDFDVPRNEQWAAIVFYRNPECIPPDFDLGQFFDFPGAHGPGAFGCELLIEGHELWANGPQSDLAPIYARSRNAVPALPVWFVEWPELEALFDTGQVYIGELESLPSLIQGEARWFEEALYPNGSAADPAITLEARGRLENGGGFHLSWHFRASAAENEVDIHLQLEEPPAPPGPPQLCHVHPHLPFC